MIMSSTIKIIYEDTAGDIILHIERHVEARERACWGETAGDMENIDATCSTLMIYK